MDSPNYSKSWMDVLTSFSNNANLSVLGNVIQDNQVNSWSKGNVIADLLLLITRPQSRMENSERAEETPVTRLDV